MLTKKISLLFFFVYSSVSLSQTVPKVIKACSDQQDWPPYTYREKSNKTKLTGYTVELLKEVFLPLKIKIEIDSLPWKRCLEQLREGKTYSMALDSSFSEERNKIYLLTDHFYEITPALFYYRDRYPNGFPPFKSFEELLKIGPICGLQGYNYSNFFRNFKKDQIDTGAKSFKAVSQKVKNGRCTSFLARVEIINGLKKIGKDFGISNHFKQVKLPNAKKEPFYILISKKLPYKKLLKNLFDKRLQELKLSGKLQKILLKNTQE